MDNTGWYYDDQVNDIMTSVTLHSNMWWEAEEGQEDKGKWVPWKEGGKNKHLDVDDDTFVNLVGMSNKGTIYGYGIDPIARSILTEDFSVSVYNTWTDFGNDFLSPLWNEVRQSAPYVKNLINSLDLIGEKSKDLDASNGTGSGLFKKIGEVAGNVSEWAKDSNAVKYLNKALVTQGTRFSYYGGTGFSFGNLGMKFIVFPKYEDGKIVTVTEQMERFYPYVIGKLEPFELKIKDTDYANYLGESYKGLLQWQSPPGGFESELKNVDVIQKGTLKLKIGPHYCLTNLVCQEANFIFSKQMVKLPIDDKNVISPLFCDVSLTLRPATLYSDIMMKKFVSGKGNYVNNNRFVTNYSTRNLTEEEKDSFPGQTTKTDSSTTEQKGTSTTDRLNEKLKKVKDNFYNLYKDYV